MKTFLKFLPIAAAVLLATSCSKDDNDNAPATQSGSDGVETVTANTIPFSIRVNTGHSLKKVGYAESTNEDEKGWYNITFSDEDVAKLKMIIKEGNTQIGEATLDNAKTATFSGGLTRQPSSNADLTAEISVSGSKNSSDESLADLLATCAHNFSGEFKFGDKTVNLTDQNAYLAISMSPCCEHAIKINTTDYTVKDGRLWVVIPSNTDIKCTELGLKDMTSAPGEYHAVARQYFTVSSTGKKVYFSKGNLQYNATPQEGENQWRFAPTQYSICHKTGDDVGDNYANWTGKWTDLFGWGMWLKDENPLNTEADNSKYLSSITTDFATFTTSSAIGSEWETLTGGNSQNPGEWNYLFDTRSTTKSIRYSKAQVHGVNGLVLLPDQWDGSYEFANHDSYNASFAVISENDWATLESQGAVFLPAAGYRDGTVVIGVGDLGYYWSSSAYGGDRAWSLYFNSDNVDPGGYDRYYGRSVRLVRRL